MAILPLPGQMDLPACPHDRRQQLQQKANAPMLASKPQKPCDHGLFSDDAAQIDLIEMLQEPTND